MKSLIGRRLTNRGQPYGVDGTIQSIYFKQPVCAQLARLAVNRLEHTRLLDDSLRIPAFGRIGQNGVSPHFTYRRRLLFAQSDRRYTREEGGAAGLFHPHSVRADRRHYSTPDHDRRTFYSRANREPAR